MIRLCLMKVIARIDWVLISDGLSFDQTISVWMFLYLVKFKADWKSLLLFGQVNGKWNIIPTGLSLLWNVHLNEGEWIFDDASNKIGDPLADCERLKSKENVQWEFMTAFFDGVTEVIGASCYPVFVCDW